MRIAIVLALLAGCAVDPALEASSTEELGLTPLPADHTTNACGFGYCADITYYCPPNPLLECEVWCLQTCYPCDDGQICVDNPLPE